jgi:ribosomal protein L37AE/L43A
MTDVNKLSDTELAFEYRDLRENNGFKKEHDRYTNIEREIVKRELRRRDMEGVEPRDSILPGLTGSYPGKKPSEEEEDKPYWCESCHSHNIRRLGERGRPWHCNDCGREFPDVPIKRAFIPPRATGHEAQRLLNQPIAISRTIAIQILKSLKPDVYPDPEEFYLGINDEYDEHSKTIAKLGGDKVLAAGMIALDHLSEDPHWYSKAKKAGL